MLTSLTEEQMAEFMRAFDNLPPSNSLSVFPSEDELYKFLEQKGFWLSLKQALSNHYNGQPRYEGIFFESSIGKAFFDVKLDKYEALYDMLSWGWYDIQQAFNGITMPGDTPGELFAYILESEACSSFEDNKKPLDPQILYRGWCQYKKYLETSDAERQQELTKLETLLARLKRQRKKLGDEEEISEHLAFVSLCVEICLKSKDQRIKSKAVGYLDAKDNHIDMITRQLRRQKFDLSKNQPIPKVYIIPGLHHLIALYTNFL